MSVSDSEGAGRVRYRLRIPIRLPGLNEIIESCKGAGGTGRKFARLKRELTQTIALLAQSQKLKPVQRASFLFTWREPNKRRDLDNVAAGGRKLILDGLVQAGVLPGDGWAHVRGWEDTFQHVTSGEGVEVWIKEEA